MALAFLAVDPSEPAVAAASAHAAEAGHIVEVIEVADVDDTVGLRGLDFTPSAGSVTAWDTATGVMAATYLGGADGVAAWMDGHAASADRADTPPAGPDSPQAEPRGLQSLYSPHHTDPEGGALEAAGVVELLRAAADMIAERAALALEAADSRRHVAALEADAIAAEQEAEAATAALHEAVDLHDAAAAKLTANKAQHDAAAETLAQARHDLDAAKAALAEAEAGSVGYPADAINRIRPLAETIAAEITALADHQAA